MFPESLPVVSYRSVVRLVGALLVVVLSPQAPTAMPFDPTLSEIPSEVRLPRWEEASRAIQTDRARLERCLEDVGACPTPRLQAWRALVIDLQDEPAAVQLAAVNRFVNRIPYVADMDQYGRSDFWAGPWRFLQSSGDCEDYAIAKYVTLRKLGHAADDLRILVVEDLDRDLAHAVLAVRDGGDIWLLDNQFGTLVRAEEQVRYAPYYAVNEENRWLHRLPGAAGAVAGR